MGDFFDNTIQGLLEAAEIERGEIPLVQRKICRCRHLLLMTKRRS